MNTQNTKFWEKLIEHQFLLILQENHISINDLNNLEKLKYRYNIALQLLCELGE